MKNLHCLKLMLQKTCCYAFAKKINKILQEEKEGHIFKEEKLEREVDRIKNRISYIVLFLRSCAKQEKEYYFYYLEYFPMLFVSSCRTWNFAEHQHRLQHMSAVQMNSNFLLHILCKHLMVNQVQINQQKMLLVEIIVIEHSRAPGLSKD